MSAVSLSVAAFAQPYERPAHAHRHHRLPTPAWLKPQRVRPRELASLDPLLVTAPRIVDQKIETPVLYLDSLEHGCNLCVIPMVTGQRNDPIRKIRGRNTATGEVDGQLLAGERLSNPQPDAPAGPGDQGYLPTEILIGGFHHPSPQLSNSY